jgi:hypothetical protein
MLQIEVEIQNDGDDDAHEIQLIVTLPPTSQVLREETSAELTGLGEVRHDPSRGDQTVNGSAIFQIPHLGRDHDTRSFKLSATMCLFAAAGTSVGAFVFGSVPDQRGKNNFCSVPVVSGASQSCSGVTG